MQPNNPSNYPPGYPPGYPYPLPPQNGSLVPPSYGQPLPQYPGQPNYPPQPGLYGQPTYYSSGMPPPVMPRPPINPGMVPMPPPANMLVGATIVKAPTLVTPPPGWKPTITSVGSNPSSSLIRQPISLYIGKIPESLSDAILQKILECCGRVQKWNRPVDATTQTPKAFGFVTYEYGINALRCMNVLPYIDIDGAPLQLKASTKEQAALDALAEEEKLAGDDGTTAYEQQQLKQSILSILAMHYKPHQQELDDLTDGVLAAATGSSSSVGLVPVTDTVVSTSVSAEADLDPVALSEIEKFRLRQAQRDKELEQKKLSKVSDKILEYQRQQQTAAEKPAVSEKSKASSSALSYGELLIDNTGKDSRRSDIRTGPSIGERRLRGDRDDREDEEEAEAKRRRKQQVLRMLAGDSEALDSQPMAVKVKLANASSSTVTKKPATGGSSATNLNTNDDNDSTKPKRLPVPIDYSEEELKQESIYQYHMPTVDDDDELQDKLIKRNQTPADISAAAIANASANALKQAQAISYASSKAAEIAAKISSEMKSLGSSSTSKAATTDEDAQKQRQKSLVDQIPTEKSEVFAYPIDWVKADSVDVVEKSMKPWIQKKVVEYLGEVEDTLVSFILSKLKGHCSPDYLLKELEPVLDEDAEPFVIKLWRMLIFMILKE